MECPLPFISVSAVIARVLVSVMVPSQANVTVPPPVMAARSAVSVQLVTTPPAKTREGRNRAKRTRRDFIRVLSVGRLRHGCAIEAAACGGIPTILEAEGSGGT